MKPTHMMTAKDRIHATTPMRCPICDSTLDNVMIRDLGGITADLVWQLHAGHCPDHGWFQCEVISKPPREIFPVDRPFGVARKLVLDGDEIYAFSTVWNDLPGRDKLKPVDPFDRQYWKVRRQARKSGA